MFPIEKSFKYFFCEKCNYKCYTKFEFSKHISTSRHKTWYWVKPGKTRYESWVEVTNNKTLYLYVSYQYNKIIVESMGGP